ncbi:uncharacterized protein [Triticum aestivum]|uniref:uncharacterized protein isoform X2 n=1 Tax=Triticum aestivum TaxID=4565 RepID=UPI001D006109|nr:uncharacterized protein LOC123149184 isoform X2 [Triticum aestivum]
MGSAMSRRTDPDASDLMKGRRSEYINQVQIFEDLTLWKCSADDLLQVKRIYIYKEQSMWDQYKDLEDKTNYMDRL